MNANGGSIRDADLKCVGRWFDLNAALLGMGATTAAFGTGLATYGVSSRGPRTPAPILSASRNGFMLGVSGRW